MVKEVLHSKKKRNGKKGTSIAEDGTTDAERTTARCAGEI